MNNQQKLKAIVNKSPFHSAMIIEALHKYVDAILTNEEQVKKDMSNGMIDADTWIQVAKDVKDILNK